MVVDYLVDFSYLAGELKKNSTESRFFMGLKMLCDTVEFDNARLIADEQLQCLGPLKELYTTFDDTVYEERKKKRVIGRLFMPNETIHWFRKVPNYNEIGAGSELSPSPMFAISKEGYGGAHWQIGRRSCFSLEKYYEDWEGEKRRIQLAKRRTYGNSYSASGEFEDAISRFGCSDTSFKIFDRYAIGLGNANKLRDACRNILYWIKMLSNGLQNSCTFEIWANCEEGMLKNECDLATALSRNFEQLRGSVFGSNTTPTQVIKFHLVPGNGMTLVAPQFHDRFVCSRTRVMSIGKGVDALNERGLPTCINLQYCGRYHSDVLMKSLQDMQAEHLQTIET